MQMGISNTATATYEVFGDAAWTSISQKTKHLHGNVGSDTIITLQSDSIVVQMVNIEITMKYFSWSNCESGIGGGNTGDGGGGNNGGGTAMVVSSPIKCQHHNNQ